MNRSVLVGTSVGAAAQWVRDRVDLVRTALTGPEALGTVANDAITRRLIEGLCRDGKAFVDVGAHIGSVIDGVRRHSRPGHIYALEAIPAKADNLKARFPDVTVINRAAGEVNGEMPFFVNHSKPGYSSLFREHENSRDRVEEIVVPISRLDDLLPHDGIDLVKIDVEGAELGVLRGSDAIVAASAPVIVFESGPETVGRYTKEDLWDWFDQAGYALLVPNRVAHLDDGLSRDGFIESHLYPRRTTDYVAVPRRHRDEVRARARRVLRLD
jgi:FkbM family methyltransferase